LTHELPPEPTTPPLHDALPISRSARAVGGAIARCPDDVPWHRVVNAQGRISRRRQTSGMLTQRIRLEQEGVKLRGGRVPLTKYRDRKSTRLNSSHQITSYDVFC